VIKLELAFVSQTSVGTRMRHSLLNNADRLRFQYSLHNAQLHCQIYIVEIFFMTNLKAPFSLIQIMFDILIVEVFFMKNLPCIYLISAEAF
jgi:hypothetical protein